MQNLTDEQKDYLIELFDNLQDFMYIDMYDSEEDDAKPIYRAMQLEAIKQVLWSPEYYRKPVKNGIKEKK